MDIVGYLGAALDGQLVALRIIFGECGVRFYLNLADLSAAVGVLVYECCFGEPAIHVTEIEFGPPFNIAGAFVM